MWPSGRALGWGPRECVFDSRHSDAGVQEWNEFAAGYGGMISETAETTVNEVS